MPGGEVQATDTQAVMSGSRHSYSRQPFDLTLSAILVIAGALRLGVLLIRSSDTSRFLNPDSAGYLTLSRDLSAFVSASHPHFSLSMVRTPVYPIYLAVAGHVTHSAFVGPMLVQVTVAVGLVYVTYRLGFVLFDRTTGLWAALLLGIDPLSIIYSSLVLTETLFAFLLAWSVLLLWHPNESRWQRGLASGLLLGVATLTRPVSLYLSIPLVIGYLLLERTHLRNAIIVALSFTLGFGFVAGAWVIRNDVMGGVPTISTIESHNLLYYRAVGALEEGHGLPPDVAHSYVSTQLHARLPGHPSLALIDRTEQSLARAIILNNPIGYAKEVLKGGGRLAFGTGGTELEPATAGHAIQIVEAYAVLYLLALYLLVIRGVWAAWRENRLRSCVLPLIALFYVAIISSGLDAYSRFRLPIMPFLALLAGHGAQAIAEARSRGSFGTRFRPWGRRESPPLSTVTRPEPVPLDQGLHPGCARSSHDHPPGIGDRLPQPLSPESM